VDYIDPALFLAEEQNAEGGTVTIEPSQSNN
jgi:hypothetical protein